MLSKLNRGFTLVELAIVIVIIGLLVGGVLQGQELIKQAKIRSQIKQLEGYDIAALTFKSKYNIIPGDVSVATGLKFNISSTSPSGGNGILEDFQLNIPNVFAYYEGRSFFFNLTEKKLIKEYTELAAGSNNYSVGVMFPEASVGGGVAAIGMPDGVYYFLGPTLKNDITNRATYVTNSPNPPILPSDAFGLDDKIDNGIPSSGKIRAITLTGVSATNFANDNVTSNCLGADDQAYNLASDKPLCRLIVKSKVD